MYVIQKDWSYVFVLLFREKNTLLVKTFCKKI